MFFQHNGIASKYDAGQIVDGLVRRHLRAMWLVRQEARTELLNFFFRSAYCGRRYLLMVANYEQLFAA